MISLLEVWRSLLNISQNNLMWTWCSKKVAYNIMLSEPLLSPEGKSVLRGQMPSDEIHLYVVLATNPLTGTHPSSPK